MKNLQNVQMVNIKGAKNSTWIEIPFKHEDLVKSEILSKKLKEFVPENTSFTTHIRIRHSNNEFKMAGPQFGGINRSEKDLTDVDKIAKQRIENTRSRYLIKEDDIDYYLARICLTAPSFLKEFSDIEGFSDILEDNDFLPEDNDFLSDDNKPINENVDEQLSIDDYNNPEPLKSQLFKRELDCLLDQTKKLLSKRVEKNMVEKNMVDKSKANMALKIPTSIIDVKQLKTESSNGYIKKIAITIDNEEKDFLSIIKEKVFLLPKSNNRETIDFTEDYKFYMAVNKSGVAYVLAVQKKESKTIKIKYSIEGVIMAHVTDTVVDRENNIIKRSYDGNKNEMFLDINNGNVRVLRTKLSLSPIKKLKGLVPIANRNLGSIDLETYKDDDGTWKVYACGFKTVLTDKCNIYYVDGIKDSSEIVIDMINDLLRPKYSYVNFYCHNLAGYDIVFILNVLYRYNEKHEKKVYDIKLTYKDDKILNISIVKKSDQGKNKHKLVIKDSYSILPESLENLGKNLEVDNKKSKFPYDFVKKNTLFYKGITPDIYYYQNVTQQEYNEELLKENWSLKEETIKYLENDLSCLLEILNKTSKQIHRDYTIDMTNKLTISGLAMQLYLSSYYPKQVIPTVNDKKSFLDLQKAYFGGITEVYKPHGYNLYYYDVNSLYPSVAFNDMPGLDCYKIDFYSKPNIQDKEFFGFFYCDIETPLNDYFGVLPYRDKTGVHHRLGKWSGWYFSEELKYSESLGYKINVKKGYMFSRQEKVFDDYINDIYKIKSTTKNKTQRTIAKSMLNNLLGRFGINIDKPITRVLDVNEFNEYSTMYKIDSFKEITETKYLVTYYPYLDKQLINQQNIDITKLIPRFKDREPLKNSNASIVISSAINGYARIFMSKLKLDILNKNGKIYYSDTDSIVTNIELTENVHDTDLGKLKLEYKLKEGIFIAGKTYCLVTQDNRVIIKAKGFNNYSLNYNDFRDLLDAKNVIASKTISSKSWDKGYVSIQTINAVINALGSEKRTRIYQDNKWIDTKPVYMDRSTKKTSH